MQAFDVRLEPTLYMFVLLLELYNTKDLLRFSTFIGNVNVITIIRLTRRVSIVEQELLTLSEHLSSSPVFKWGSCYLICSFMCTFCRSLFSLFLLATVLYVLLRFTNSDYPFFKLFLFSENSQLGIDIGPPHMFISKTNLSL